MRICAKTAGVLRQASTEISADDHNRLRAHARSIGVSVQELLRRWILPEIHQLPEPKEAA